MQSTSTDLELRRAELEYNLRKKTEKTLCEKSFEQFVRSAWHVLEPGTPLIWNWHLTYLCEECQKQIIRIAEGRKREYHLCINVPPSSLKSMIFTRMANAWAWIHWPWMRFITASYSAALAEEHALDTKMVIKSQWYQDHWSENYYIMPDQDSKSFYRTNERGQRQITSVGASAVGRHAHIIVPDDLLNPKGSTSEADLKEADRFWTRQIQSRFIKADVGMFWVIQQRLSVQDTTGRILEREAEKYKHICLPAEEKDWISPPELRRYYINGLLFPTKFPQKFIDEQKALDPVMCAAQYNQRPSPEEGDIFKRKNWKFWLPAGISLEPVTVNVGTDTFTCPNVVLPKSFDNEVCSWDFAFKDKETSDDVAGEVWAVSGSNVYLLAEDCGKKDYSKSCSSMIKLKNDWPLTSKVLIEDKANGSAIISMFKNILPGIFPIQANKGDSPKTKALVVSRMQESGNVILPHPVLPGYQWVKKFLDEYSDYTGDDSCKNNRVAAGCQAVIHLTQGKPVFEYYDYKQVDINFEWKEMKPEHQLYCSIWVEPDLTTSAILAIWNQRTGKMAIFDEFISSSPMPEIIKAALDIKVSRRTGGVITDLDKFMFIGNPLMFARKDAAKSTRQTSIKEGISESYIRAGIPIQDNVMYEERGAITITDRKFSEKAIWVDRKAPETGRQPAAWSYEGKDPAPGHGCARALCNLSVMVYEETKGLTKDRRLPEYSPIREAIQNEINTEEDEDKLGRYIHQRPNFSGDSKQVGGSDGWMI